MKRKNILKALVGMVLIASIFASTVFAIPLSDVYINGYRKGDVNQDGCLDDDDLDLILNVLSKGNKEEYERYLELGDMTGDGKLTVLDLNMLLGMVTDPSNFPKGDLTRDGKVTIKDSEMALEISLGKVELTDVYLEIGDLDNDNQITIKDVRLILDSINEDFIKGDLDRNGAVNANDAAVALDLYKYGNVSESDMQIGDMNDDGVINANDAALILDVYKYGE